MIHCRVMVLFVFRGFLIWFASAFFNCFLVNLEEYFFQNCFLKIFPPGCFLHSTALNYQEFFVASCSQPPCNVYFILLFKREMLYLVLEPKLIFYLSALPSFFLLHFSFCFIFFLQNSTKKSLPHQIYLNQILLKDRV